MLALIVSPIVEDNEAPIKKQGFTFVFFPSQMEDGDLQHGLFSMAKLLLVVMAIEGAASYLQRVRKWGEERKNA